MKDHAPFERLLATQLSAGDAYRLMTSMIVPRPIAWVSTLDESGRSNLAPFSYFQGVCSQPPMVMLSIGARPDGRPKDTLANILSRREFTISHVGEPLAEAMNVTAASVEPDVDEWDGAGEVGARLAEHPSAEVGPPWVARAQAAMECRMVRVIPLGEGPPGGGPSTSLVIAEIVVFWCAPGLIERDERGRIQPLDPRELASVGRLGGISYARTRDVFALERPSSHPRK